jgi:hypothetical protein
MTQLHSWQKKTSFNLDAAWSMESEGDGKTEEGELFDMA